MKFSFDHNAENIIIDLTPTGSGNSYRVAIGEDVFRVEILRAEHERLDFRLIRLDHPISAPSTVAPSTFSAYVSSDKAKRWVTVNGQTYVLSKSSGARRSGQARHHGVGELTAPMPGQVRAVHVSQGDAVTKGQTLLLLEAMKMEIRIQAPQNGTVKKLFVQEGQTVEREQLLVEIE